jgi:hypothetical protein
MEFGYAEKESKIFQNIIEHFLKTDLIRDFHNLLKILIKSLVALREFRNRISHDIIVISDAIEILFEDEAIRTDLDASLCYLSDLRAYFRRLEYL